MCRREQPSSAEDRAHLLIDATARQFVRSWCQGIIEGPSPEVMKAIDGVVDDNVTLRSLGLLDRQSGKVRAPAYLR